MTTLDKQQPARPARRRPLSIRTGSRPAGTRKPGTGASHNSAWDAFSKWSMKGRWRRRLFGLAVVLTMLGTVGTTVPTIGGAIEYVAVKVRIPGAFERALPEELKSGVRVVERSTTLDLSGWKPTTSTDLQTGRKISRGLSLTSFVVRKTEPGAKYLVHTVSSGSKADPSIWCDSHPFRVVKAKDQQGSGIRQWNVLVDISQEPDDAPFTVNLLTTFWNGFQKPSDWWGGFRVLHSTEKANYTIVFPPGRPAEDLKFRYKDITANQTVGLDRSKLHVSPAASTHSDQKVTWTVENPLPDRSYQVAWTWPESLDESR